MVATVNVVEKTEAIVIARGTLPGDIAALLTITGFVSHSEMSQDAAMKEFADQLTQWCKKENQPSFNGIRTTIKWTYSNWTGNISHYLFKIQAIR